MLYPLKICFIRRRISPTSGLLITMYFRNVEAEKTCAISVLTLFLFREVVMSCPEVCNNRF